MWSKPLAATLLLCCACTGRVMGDAGPAARTDVTNSTPEVGGQGPSVFECVAGLQACGTSCVDVAADVAHCGGCNQPCAAEQICSAGVCSCPVGETLCADACVSTETSHEHCGDCSVACNADEACLAGKCGGPFG